MIDEQNEIHSLLDGASELAEKLLAEEGEFYPYGVVLQNDLSISTISAFYDSDSKMVDPKLMLDRLKDHFGQTAAKENVKCYGIVYHTDAEFLNKESFNDAILIRLRHSKGFGLEVYLPYKISGNKELIFSEFLAAEPLPDFK